MWDGGSAHEVGASYSVKSSMIIATFISSRCEYHSHQRGQYYLAQLSIYVTQITWEIWARTHTHTHTHTHHDLSIAGLMLHSESTAVHIYGACSRWWI